MLPPRIKCMYIGIDMLYLVVPAQRVLDCEVDRPTHWGYAIGLVVTLVSLLAG